MVCVSPLSFLYFVNFTTVGFHHEGVHEGLPWYTEVLLGAERFIDSSPKGLEETNRQNALEGRRRKQKKKNIPGISMGTGIENQEILEAPNDKR